MAGAERAGGAARRFIENRTILQPQEWADRRWRAAAWQRLRREILDALEATTDLPFPAAIIGIVRWQESDEPWALAWPRPPGEPLPRELRIRVVIETGGR